MALVSLIEIKKLIEKKILDWRSASGANTTLLDGLFFPGDTIPEGIVRYAQITAIDLRREPSVPRQNSDSAPEHTAIAEVTVTIMCYATVSAMRASAGSLASVIDGVMEALADQTMTSADNIHQIDFTTYQVVDDAQPDPLRQAASAAVILSGMAFRATGNAMTEIIS